jgi:cell division protein FtsZ
MAETAEIPSPAPRRTETSQTSAFGDWDLRRETIVRPTDSVVSPVERFEAPSLHDEDELDTPPFFKNR